MTDIDLKELRRRLRAAERVCELVASRNFGVCDGNVYWWVDDTPTLVEDIEAWRKEKGNE